jgi:Chaperone of endosialidase
MRPVITTSGLGFNAGYDVYGDFNIHIGSGGEVGDDRTIRIGDQGNQTSTYIAGISGVAVAGDPVVVNSSGQIGVGMASSRRFKDEIKPMGDASEAILALKPVTFRYKDDLDPKRMLRFGLVAEEVEKVNPDLVARDAKGEVYVVRYEAVNAMLLNEFLKEHRKVQELESAVAQLTAHIEEQDSKLQKVSEQLEMQNPAPQVVSRQ